VSRVEAAGLRSQGTGSGDTHLRQTLALQMKGVNSDIKSIHLNVVNPLKKVAQTTINIQNWYQER